MRDGEGVKPHAVILLKPRTILKTTSGKLRRRDLRLAYAQLDTIADAGAFAAGVAPHAPPAATGWGLLSGRVAPAEAAGVTNALIATDAVLRYWKETGPSRQAGTEDAPADAASSEAAQPPAAEKQTAAEAAALAAFNAADEDAAAAGRPAEFSGLSGGPLLQAEQVLGYSACDTESPADMAWAMRSSYAIAWGFTIAQTASTLQAEALRAGPHSPHSDGSVHGDATRASGSTPGARGMPVPSARSSVGSTVMGEPSSFGECPVEGLEVLLTGCKLTPRLTEATAWFEEQVGGGGVACLSHARALAKA